MKLQTILKNPKVFSVICIIQSMCLILLFTVSLFLIQAPDPFYIVQEIALKVVIGLFSIPTSVFLLFSARSIGRTMDLGKSHLRILLVLYSVSFIGFVIALIWLRTPSFDFWIVRENGQIFALAFEIIWFTLLAYFLISAILFWRYLQEKLSRPLIKTQFTVLVLTILIGSSGFIYYFLTLGPSYYTGCVGPSVPPFDLPSGLHYNNKLDMLGQEDQWLLQVLENASWNFLKLRQPCGGFPIYATEDFCHFYGDGSNPMFPNEISLQSGTPRIGAVYIALYLLEPNPNWLSVAKGVGDALVLAQDEVNFGFYYNARFDSQNQPYQPHPSNPRRHAVYDDDVTQGCIRFLLDLYNNTKEPKYLEAINKGFIGILNSQYAWGAWPQRTNYQFPEYPVWSTLNDGLMDNMIRLLWKGVKMLPENRTRLLESMNKSLDWLLQVQGSGGSPMQKAWAQQYDFNHKPAWARKFEPPAYDAAETSKMIKLFLELYCEFGDVRLLESAKAAVEWLNQSKITYTENGDQKIGWARLYEPQTNLPIYGVREWGPNHDPPYTYNMNEASSGYAFWGNWGEDAIEKWNYFLSVGNSSSAYLAWLHAEPSLSSARTSATQSAQRLNKNGFWVEDNKLYDKNFEKNAKNLINYLKRV